MEYTEKVILITGASLGIGQAVALALSHHHNSIVITARRRELLESAAEQIRQNGSACTPFTGNALVPEHADLVVSETVKKRDGSISPCSTSAMARLRTL